MRDDDYRDLEDALRALPLARAPQTLAPRVMAAVRARLQPPVVRTWFDWPVLAQVASLAVFLTLVACAAMVWPSVELLGARVADHGVIRLLALVFRTVWQPVALWFLVCVTVVALACATFGALLGRVALGGASR